MTDTLEDDPHLNAILSEAIMRQAQDAIDVYVKMRDEQEKALMLKAAELARTFLLVTPFVYAIGWETVTGEFDDSGYGGYEIHEDVYFKFNQAHIPFKYYDRDAPNYEAEGLLCSFHDHEEDDDGKLQCGSKESAETDIWQQEFHVKLDDRQEKMLSAIYSLLVTCDHKLEDEYGTGMVYFDTNGMFQAADW